MSLRLTELQLHLGEGMCLLFQGVNRLLLRDGSLRLDPNMKVFSRMFSSFFFPLKMFCWWFLFLFLLFFICYWLRVGLSELCMDIYAGLRLMTTVQAGPLAILKSTFVDLTYVWMSFSFPFFFIHIASLISNIFRSMSNLSIQPKPLLPDSPQKNSSNSFALRKAMIKR